MPRLRLKEPKERPIRHEFGIDNTNSLELTDFTYDEFEFDTSNAVVQTSSHDDASLKINVKDLSKKKKGYTKLFNSSTDNNENDEPTMNNNKKKQKVSFAHEGSKKSGAGKKSKKSKAAVPKCEELVDTDDEDTASNIKTPTVKASTSKGGKKDNINSTKKSSIKSPAVEKSRPRLISSSSITILPHRAVAIDNRTPRLHGDSTTTSFLSQMKEFLLNASEKELINNETVISTTVRGNVRASHLLEGGEMGFLDFVNPISCDGFDYGERNDVSGQGLTALDSWGYFGDLGELALFLDIRVLVASHFHLTLSCVLS
jgi:hypothetical protein